MTPIKPKSRPSEIWQEILDEVAEFEIEQAASVSVEQAERDLAEAGFDVAAERARAEAFLDALEGKVSEKRLRTVKPTGEK